MQTIADKNIPVGELESTLQQIFNGPYNQDGKKTIRQFLQDLAKTAQIAISGGVGECSRVFCDTPSLKIWFFLDGVLINLGYESKWRIVSEEDFGHHELEDSFEDFCENDCGKLLAYLKRVLSFLKDKK